MQDQRFSAQEAADLKEPFAYAGRWLLATTATDSNMQQNFIAMAE